jgi:hypothetical protein
VAAWIGTWIARHQEHVIELLKAENRLVLDGIGGRPISGPSSLPISSPSTHSRSLV